MKNARPYQLAAAALILLALAGCAAKQEPQLKPSGLHKLEFPAVPLELQYPERDHSDQLIRTSLHVSRCGVERQAIKTLSDPQGQELLAHPDTIVHVSMGQLLAEPAPSRKQLLAATGFRWPIERTLYEIDAYLVGYKLEADGDYHIVLADLHDLVSGGAVNGAPSTMVVEIPSDACMSRPAAGPWITQSDFADAFGQPSPRFRHIAPVKVRIIGVGFFDFIHGQTGVAVNGVELHPVLSIVKSIAQ